MTSTCKTHPWLPGPVERSPSPLPIFRFLSCHVPPHPTHALVLLTCPPLSLCAPEVLEYPFSPGPPDEQFLFFKIQLQVRILCLPLSQET